jgi:hypothetical protein
MTRSESKRLLAFVAVILFSASAFGQSGDNAAASRALFNEARALVAKGKIAEACPKFEESLRLNHGIGTQFNLADCYEKLGRTASAWGLFLEVAAQARAAGQGERESVARERAGALEPKLARLTIEVARPVTGLEVRRDGTLVGAASYQTAVPVDPGVHAVEATAPGMEPWKGEINVPPGPTTVSVKVPELARTAAAAPEGAPAPNAAGTSGAAVGPPEKDTGPADKRSSWSGQKTLALAAAGVGVAGAVVGAVFFTKYQTANEKAEKICPTPASPCPTGSKALHDGHLADARSARTLTYVGAGVGVAGLAAGAVLWFTAPSGESASRSGPRFMAVPLPGGFSASFDARF